MGPDDTDEAPRKGIPASWFVAPVGVLFVVLVVVGAVDLYQNVTNDHGAWEVWTEDPLRDDERDILHHHAERTFSFEAIMSSRDILVGGGYAGTLPPGQYTLEVQGDPGGNVTYETVTGNTGRCEMDGGACTFTFNVTEPWKPAKEQYAIRWLHEAPTDTEGYRLVARVTVATD